MSAQPDFDRVARVYRWAEYLTLGPLLQRTRTHFLPQLLACRRALVLGDGDGRFLARLMAQNRGLQAVAVDTSAVMLRLLRARCGDEARLTTWCGSALDFLPLAGFDVVVTHFFLDCLTQVEVDELVSRIGEVAPAGMLWVVSDFGLPRLRWFRPFAAVYIRALYFAFGVLTGLRVTRLPEHDVAMESAGFMRVERCERVGGLLYAEVWRRG